MLHKQIEVSYVHLIKNSTNLLLLIFCYDISKNRILLEGEEFNSTNLRSRVERP